jgi:hypothetical protein
MIPIDRIQAAREKGITDEQIVDSIKRKYPKYAEKIDQGLSRGFTIEQLSDSLNRNASTQTGNDFKGLSKKESLAKAEELGLMGPSKERQSQIMGSVMGGLVGAPKAAVQFPRQVADWVQTLFTGKSGQELPESIQPFFDSLQEVADVLPSSGSIREGTIRSQLSENPELAQQTAEMPPDLLEKILGGVQGGATLGGGAGGILGGVQPTMEEGLEAIGASDRVKAGANLLLLGSTMLKPKEGLQFKPKEKPVGEFLRKSGLPDEQIAVVLAGKNPNRNLNKLASKRGKSELILEATKSGMESVLETFEQGPYSETVLDIPARVEMEQAMNETLQKLSAKERRYIQEDIQDFMNSPRTVGDAVNLYRDINKTYGTRNQAAMALKQHILEMLEKVDPQLATDFRLANEAYSGYATIRNEFRPKDLATITTNMAKNPSLALFAGALLGTPVLGLKAVGLGFLASRLAREMVLNPKFRNLSRKMGTQISRRSFATANQTKEELAIELDKIDPRLGSEFRKAKIEELLE